MKKFSLLSLFSLLIIIGMSIVFFDNVFAQENHIIPPRVQWSQLPDPDKLTCNEGLILIQKINGEPACVSSSTFLKLVDRGYGKFDLSQLMKRPIMMNYLMEGIIEDSRLMNHWHTMMINDPKIMQQTASNMVLRFKENPKFLANVMGPMTTNPELREQMIGQMKNHNHMMDTFQEHSGWMNSVHQPMMGSDMHQGTNIDVPSQDGCSWCPELVPQNLQHHSGFHRPEIMEDMMHHIWINEKMQIQMQELMLESTPHMSKMLETTMNPILDSMMDDSELRQKMIEMMLEHQEFMNSIRHEDRFSN